MSDLTDSDSLLHSHEVCELGKGALQCAVVDPYGAEMRVVSIKARFDRQTKTVCVLGAPVLVKPEPAEYTELAFNPFFECDPLTGDSYSKFCYVDDTGKCLDIDSPRVDLSSMTIQVSPEPTDDDVQSQDHPAETMAGSGG